MRITGTPSGASVRAVCSRCSSEPPKRVGSVSTETAQAPPCAYACTRLSMSVVCCDRSPAEGDASLHSAMMSKPSGESFKRGAVGARAHARPQCLLGFVRARLFEPREARLRHFGEKS